ncbi:hypothetical protein [Bacillus mycoides]|uniref:hypothetical protein n=1 Tax=Bacillus mycoides TaxID=1405 RepID=UPI003A7FE994
MKFWALAYLYQDEIFYDFQTEEDTMEIVASCLLPTKGMAEDFISAHLSHDDYVPVEINLESLKENGVYSYTRGRVDNWDDEYDQEG